MVLICLSKSRARHDCECGKSDQSKVGFHGCLLVIEVKRTGEFWNWLRKAAEIAVTGLVSRIVRGIETLLGAAGLNSPSDRDGAVSGEDLGRSQESLGIDACREERLTRYEASGNRGAIENAAFAGGGNACSTTARSGRVHAAQAAITSAIVVMIVLACCDDVSCHLARAARGGGRNLSRDADLGSDGFSLLRETSPHNGAACDQDDRGEQGTKLGQSDFHALNVAKARGAALMQVNAANR